MSLYITGLNLPEKHHVECFYIDSNGNIFDHNYYKYLDHNNAIAIGHATDLGHDLEVLFPYVIGQKIEVRFFNEWIQGEVAGYDPVYGIIGVKTNHGTQLLSTARPDLYREVKGE